MSVKIYLYEIMQYAKEKYPDAVEYRIVNSRTVQEDIGSIAIRLDEIEPETEVYMAMSPKTKICYMYLIWEEYGGP